MLHWSGPNGSESCRKAATAMPFTTPRHPAKRALMEFSRADAAATAPETSELVVGTGEHECYTPEYRTLTRDFYLKC